MVIISKDPELKRLLENVKVLPAVSIPKGILLQLLEKLFRGQVFFLPSLLGSLRWSIRLFRLVLKPT